MKAVALRNPFFSAILDGFLLGFFRAALQDIHFSSWPCAFILGIMRQS